MKANELRIGNWILFKLDNEYIKFDYMMLDWDNASDIHAIPLTEEWLIKFGFEKTGNKLNLGIMSLGVGKSFISCMIKGCYINLNIKYVHQLQNLYYALTGEELSKSC